MSGIEEVQEQLKVDMEAMKDQITAITEAMLTMKKIMESNAAAIATKSVAIEGDSTHPLGLKQVNPPISDMVGQEGEALGSTGGPMLCRARIISHHAACLPTILHPMLHILPRMSITLLPYSLKANNPNLIMHMSLNPWGRHMKYPTII